MNNQDSVGDKYSRRVCREKFCQRGSDAEVTDTSGDKAYDALKMRPEKDSRNDTMDTYPRQCLYYRQTLDLRTDLRTERSMTALISIFQNRPGYFVPSVHSELRKQAQA